MNYFFVYMFILSFFFCSPKAISLGVSDKLGIFGTISAEHTKKNPQNNKTRLVFSYGFFGIPTIGGGAATLVSKDERKRLSPYINISAMCIYVIPISNSSVSPAIVFRPLLNMSAGLDLNVLKLKKKNVRLNVGVMSIYDFGASEIFTSPSDSPYLWPIFNIKISKNLLVNA